MNNIKKLTESKLGVSVSDVSPLGKGASGSVYLVLCDKAPSGIAVKVSSHPELMKKEFEMLSFLKENFAFSLAVSILYHLISQYVNAFSVATTTLNGIYKKKLGKIRVFNILV